MNKKNIAIFASGNGSNFEALATACKSGAVAADVKLLVCDKPNAFAIERAQRLGIPCMVFSPKDYASKAEYEQLICEKMQACEVDLICLAGYMRIIGETLLQAYKGRILNIHPALLPSFKGAHAIDDAFNFGVKVFGVTVHFIDENIDGGVIVAQRAFEYHGTSRDEVEAKIHAIEHELYPEAVQAVLNNI